MKNNMRFISFISIFLSVSILAFFSMVSLSADLSAGEKRGFVLDDLYQLKGVSGINISPDGTHLLFSVREYNLKKASSKRNIFVLNLKTGKQKQLTFAAKNDNSPYWSADGEKIYFLSNRE